MSDFQAQASKQGRAFEEAVAHMLSFLDWRIIDTRAKVEGVEVDLIAEDPDGIVWWIECKGSHRGAVPGSRRGDTVKKAVGVAWYLHQLPERRPYMLITSHLPTSGSVADLMLRKAQSAGLFDKVAVLQLPGYDAEDVDE